MIEGNGHHSKSGLSVHNSHRLIILVEVSVRAACQSTSAMNCSHRATSMLLILVEVSVKVACLQE